MENLLQPWSLSSLRQGKLAVALPASRTAARCNKSPRPTSGRSLQRSLSAVIPSSVVAFDIAGDELTGEEAAAILSKVTGREIHYEGFHQTSYVPRAKICL